MAVVQSASARWLIAIGLVVVALVIASVVINVVQDNADHDMLSADTPEGTVQRYLLALQEDDREAAYSFFSESLENCTLQHFLEATEYRRTDEFSAELERTTSSDSRTLVTVRISESEFDPPFGSGGYSFNVIFKLEEEETGVWKFVEPPWPAEWCPPDRPVPTATPEPTPTPEPAAQRTQAEGALTWAS